MRKGEIYELNIEDISHDGWGVGRSANMVVFVRGAVLGDTVRTLISRCKKTYAQGELLQVIKPSLTRVEPDCEHFLNCGGCNLRNIHYTEELRYKTQRVKKALQKIGRIEDVSIVDDCIPCEMIDNYRNKAEFCVELKNDEVIIGFKSSKSDKVVNVADCKLQMPGINQTIEALRSLLPEYKEFIEGDGLHHLILRQSDFSGEVMLVLVSAYPDHLWAVKLAEEIVCKVDNLESVHYVVSPKHLGWNFFAESKLLYGKERIIEKIGNTRLSISPASFLQINTKQADVLYSTALNFANPSPSDMLLDLYCGAGSIGLYMADKFAAVIGAEAVESAVKDAKYNAELNGSNNIQFRLGLVEDLILDLSKMNKKPDVAIIDPPRTGCDKEFLQVLGSMDIEKIVYISCDPETMARDISLLSDFGYKPLRVQPVDMFPRTAHVETVALIQKDDH